MGELTHFDESGASRMVDVSGKEVTLRTARASGCVRMQPATLALVRDRRLAKGDVLEVARLAGIMAAKRTGELIPLCHPLGLDSGGARPLSPEPPDTIRIEATVKVARPHGRGDGGTDGGEHRRLTVYDMCKSVDRGMVIGADPARGENGRPARGLSASRRRSQPGRSVKRRDRRWIDDRFERDSGGEGWDVATNLPEPRRARAGSPGRSLRPDRRRAGRCRADLPGRAGQPVPVRATPGRSLRRFPGEAAAAGTGAARGPCLRRP